MFQAMVRAGGAINQIVYWSRLLDWKNQTLAPQRDLFHDVLRHERGADDPRNPSHGRRIDHRNGAQAPYAESIGNLQPLAGARPTE